jgi:glutamine synthetase
LDTIRPIDEAHRQLAVSLREQGVEYALAGYIDVNGRSKSKAVPVAHLPELLAGHERYTPRGLGGLGAMNAAEDECVALPDPSSLVVLPWDRRVAWMSADLLFGGREPFALCPRSVLKRQLEVAAADGFDFLIGVECEVYMVRADAVGPVGYLQPIMPSGSLKPTPAYDIEVSLDSLGVLDQMVSTLNEAGFEVFSFDAEGGDGQYEFDFHHRSALDMADKLTFFRLAAKQIAKQHGLVATFMPKPYTEAWGSGAHYNMSLADFESGANLFRDSDDARGRGWSKTAYGFVAGILRHAAALSAICAPTVNSYKRLTERLPDGTNSWAPVWATYGDNNRSCLLRLPRNRPCVEDRGVDSAANPYLTSAFLLAAGLEGVREQLDPGEPVEDLTYDWSPTATTRSRLPRTLLEAIDAFEADPLVESVFPAQFIREYVAMKRAEWNEFHGQVTEWERTKYFDMF